MLYKGDKNMAVFSTNQILVELDISADENPT
jgi:hypothetical protein